LEKYGVKLSFSISNSNIQPLPLRPQNRPN
jgi:hypothetical protein